MRVQRARTSSTDGVGRRSGGREAAGRSRESAWLGRGHEPRRASRAVTPPPRMRERGPLRRRGSGFVVGQ
ncbi:hypothetical protein WJ07_05785 [Burkholderia vietnamiensis]|nr:hypothetical protein WJ07_05785 [Burkholderia vietnamiensis]